MFMPGCPCCGIKVGFDGLSNAMPVASCYPTATLLQNLRLDVTRLPECKVVFAGFETQCACPAGSDVANGIRFSSGDWPAVADYIDNGGRLVLLLNDDYCTLDEANVASFLTAMGSTMSYSGGQFSCATCTAMSAGSANIASGISTSYRGAGEINVGTGGTSMWLMSGGEVLAAVEQIGSGFLFLCGDYEGFAGFCFGGVFACDFIERLIEYGDSDII